jgi:hypothetical protein
MHLAARTDSFGTATGYPFGVDASKVADELQAIVDGIRAGSVVVHEARAFQHASQVDFGKEEILVSFCRKDI